PTRFPVDEWALREVALSRQDLGSQETVFCVANGYLGMRGNPEEGRDAAHNGTFINGFHETSRILHAEEAFGFATVGQTIVSVPDAKVIRLYVDDEPLLLSVADLESYERTLDFRAGLLRRSLVWRTPSGKRVRVTSTRMASFAERHLAVMTYEFTLLSGSAPVVVSSQLLNRQDGANEYADTSLTPTADDDGATGTFDPRQGEPLAGRVLVPQLQRHDQARYVLGYRAACSGMTLAVGVDHVVEVMDDGGPDVEGAPDVELGLAEQRGSGVEQVGVIRPDAAEHQIRTHLGPGRTVRITKVVAYHSSRGVPAGELADRCDRTLDRALARGAAALHAGQRAWLDAFWERSDVIVHGQAEIQQAVRWCLFQLAQAVARAEGVGIPAKGVTGTGYSGHYFWDAEIFVLPFCTYTSPGVSRNLLRFRYTMLDAARRRARDLSHDGALYPWRTINGEEASAYYAAGTAQYHIDADIAYALAQYVAATGDREFLVREGIDILVETARMWADLGFWRLSGKESFHIHGVTGPDEYTTVVNDNLFTNVMAAANMATAATALAGIRDASPAEYRRIVARLGISPGEPVEWRRAAEHIHIPFDENVGIHPQDASFLDKEVWDVTKTPRDKFPLLMHFHPLVIYRFQVLKQADVVLAEFLRSSAFTPEQKLADFDYYDPLTTGDSSLSGATQAIMAAEVGYQELALSYFLDALFVDLADLHRNAFDGLHVASTGGAWSALVFGFGGMRDDGGTIRFDPRLPDLWERMSFKVTVTGTRVRIDLDHTEMVLTVEDGPGADFEVRGQPVQVRPDHPTRVALDRSEEPRLIGAPTLLTITDSVRSDGTAITTVTPTPSAEL
ncbi:MAG: glycoside hydrolase family 65 protein, partial [Micrococcales bacterium]|nr:glycoside hydrolase family 65 protein [Micrococcales bacterium]